ncbi:hypothetical protein SARC_13124, partial [Sphaeroforma arctica JP610]
TQHYVDSDLPGGYNTTQITVLAQSVADKYPQDKTTWNLTGTNDAYFETDGGVNVSRLVVWIPYPAAPAKVISSRLSLVAYKQVCKNLHRLHALESRALAEGLNIEAYLQKIEEYRATSELEDYYFEHSEPSTLVVNFVMVGWAFMQSMLGNPKVNQPDIALVGTTQVAYFHSRNTIISLDQYLQKEMQETAVNVLDDIPVTYYSDYNQEGQWFVLPFISDTRQLLYNRTTLNDLGLKHPPPVNDTWEVDGWDWPTFVAYAKNITDSGKGYGFTFVPEYDEESKIITMMCRDSGGLTFLSNQTNPGQEYSSGISQLAYRLGLNKTMYRMFEDGSLDPNHYPTDSAQLRDWVEAYPNVSLTVAPFDEYYLPVDTPFS